jgi:protoporphyrinogen oxidase
LLYPVEFKNALLNVGLYKAFRIVTDYILERLKKLVIKRQNHNFEDQIVSDFGRTLAEINMLNYTEKVWGLPSSEISSDWSKQRIKGLSLLAVLKNTILKSKKGPKTLVDQFYYPDKGTGLIYESIKDRIINREGTIKLNSQPVEIHHNNSVIQKVVIRKNSQTEVIEPDYLISSIPITTLVNLLVPKAPEEIIDKAKLLKFRAHLSLFITINKDSIFPDQWIYFPDKEIPFGRIMEPRNFSQQMTPVGKTSLVIEFFCWENDNIWNSTKDELLQLSLPWMERIGFLKKENVTESYTHKEKYAYPVYDLKYEENSGAVKKYLGNIKNLVLTGRGGCFKYNNQDHALEMGILAARSIIENKYYNIEEVGSGDEYFERGYIK